MTATATKKKRSTHMQRILDVFAKSPELKLYREAQENLGVHLARKLRAAQEGLQSAEDALVAARRDPRAYGARHHGGEAPLVIDTPDADTLPKGATPPPNLDDLEASVKDMRAQVLVIEGAKEDQVSAIGRLRGRAMVALNRAIHADYMALLEELFPRMEAYDAIAHEVLEVHDLFRLEDVSMRCGVPIPAPFNHNEQRHSTDALMDRIQTLREDIAKVQQFAV